MTCNRCIGRTSFILWLSCFLFGAFTNVNFAQQTYEKGHLPIINFTTKEYKGSAQNWCITQDTFGYIYVGNNTVLSQYDGETWRTIDIDPQGVMVTGLLNHEGKVYIGADNDFGVIQYTPQGKAYFASLKPDSMPDVGQVWNVFNIQNKIIFQTDHILIMYDASNKIFNPIKIPKPRNTAQNVLNKIYLFGLDGWCYTVTENNVLDSAYFLELHQKFVKSMVALNDTHVLLVPSYGIFYLLNTQNNTLSPWNKLPEMITQHTYYEAVLKHQQQLLIATRNQGFIQANMEGEIINFYNLNTGLNDNYVRNIFIDHQQNVWLALNNGISKVHLKADISYFTKAHGIVSIVEDIARFNGKIVLATHSGFLQLNTIQKNKAKTLELLNPMCQKIGDNIISQTWDILSMPNLNTALGISNGGIHEILPDLSTRFIKPCEAYVLYASPSDPNLVYVGVHNGVIALRYTKGTWVEEDFFIETNYKVSSITERNQKLWLGSFDEGICSQYDVKLKKKKIFDQKHSLPEGQIMVMNFENDVLFGTPVGLYRYNPVDQVFFKDLTYNYFLPDTASYIHRMSVDPQGRLWLVTYNNQDKKTELGYFSLYYGHIKWNSASFNELEEGDIHSIFHDEQGVTWLGGQYGLFRFDEKELKRFQAPYYTQIRKVVLNNDSTIFWGHYQHNETVTLQQQKAYQPSLSYDYNSVTFHFSAQDYEDNEAKLYSYYLEGFSKEWSAWSRETKAVFTNLYEGTYTFKVKTKNRYEILSTSSDYTFTVLPPWYRTTTAYVGGFILLFLGVFTGTTLYTKNLRRIIRLRTSEIVAQKEVIEEKNKDIVSSIDYAQKIQQALLPSQELFDYLFPASFIFYKPRDIVSGDFYWVGKKNDWVSFAVMDCTGHGVPGAFMSMIGNALLNELVLEKGIQMPALVLDAMRRSIINALNQNSETQRRDGMDAGLCCFNPNTFELQYSGGNISLYMVRKTTHTLKEVYEEKIIAPILTVGEYSLYEIKPDKMPVGYLHEKQTNFSNHHIQLIPKDRVYLFSDGFQDQFGGPMGKKFKKAALLKLLIEIQSMSIHQQYRKIETEFTTWKGNNDQVDDVCFLGLEV